MNEMLCVNMKVDQDSTFIFMQDLSAICCIYLLGCPWGQHPIKNYLPSTSKKTKWWMELPEGFACLIPLSMGPIFGKGRIILGCLANRLWSPFGRNTKLLCGVKTSPDRSTDLCTLREAYHLLFCVFGDFYASGTQDAEVTKSLHFH